MSRVYRSEKPVVDVNQWIKNPNGSIFIKYIPNNISKTNLRQMFAYLGVISRIDVVNIADGGTGRRAFIHFSEWNANTESGDMRNLIAKNYPLHTIVDIGSFEYSITLNSRPIPSTELNTQQLSDWSQRLNDEFVDFKNMMVSENETLKMEIARLKEINETLCRTTNNLCYNIEELEYQTQDLKNDNASLRQEIDAVNFQLYQRYEAEWEEEEAIYEHMEKNMPSEIQGFTLAELDLMDEFSEEIEIEDNRTHGEHQFDEPNMDEIERELNSYVIDVLDDGFDIETGLGRTYCSRSISVN